MSNEIPQLKPAIVRIRSKDGKCIFGLGCLISNRQVLTCAHVVTKALAMSVPSIGKPSGEIFLDFPLITDGRLLKAHIIIWNPEKNIDIAGLELQDNLPEGAQPIYFIQEEVMWLHPFGTYGFPDNHDRGVWASGVLLESISGGWIQIEDEKLTGHRVREGFSGSPVWDDKSKGIIGIVAAVDTESKTKVAYVIPTDVLVRAWPELEKTIQKFEPKTYVVDGTGKGDYVSINAAIEAANPGYKILIRPGIYQESLVVQKPLNIIGDGERGEIEVRAQGQVTLEFRATEGRISNLKLRQIGDGNRNFHCVVIDLGGPVLDECDIAGGGAGIAIRNGANPFVHRNIVHNCQIGVMIVNSKGRLWENEIYGNSAFGVLIGQNSNATLSRNFIHDSGICVSVVDGSQVLLEENNISRATDSGVLIDKSNLTMRDNKIHKCKDGVSAYNNAWINLEKNEIVDNFDYGLVINKGSNATVRSNRISNNVRGIFVGEDIGGTIENNDLRGNTKGAWDIFKHWYIKRKWVLSVNSNTER